MLNESTQAQKSSSTNTNKATTDTLPGMTLLGKALTVHGVPILSNSIADSAKFAGEGDSAQSNSLQGYITVTVQKVLPNGNLYVKGQKWIGINQGQEYVIMSGVIRPDRSRPLRTPSPPPRWPTPKSPTAARARSADANAQGWLVPLLQFTVDAILMLDQSAPGVCRLRFQRPAAEPDARRSGCARARRPDQGHRHGVRSALHQLFGYGLVVGLDGTGDQTPRLRSRSRASRTCWQSSASRFRQIPTRS